MCIRDSIYPNAGGGIITQTEISTVHTIFNIGTTVLLFPVSDWIIKRAKKMEKEDDREVDQSRVVLDDRILETPGIALQSAVSEVVRMGTDVYKRQLRLRPILRF